MKKTLESIVEKVKSPEGSAVTVASISGFILPYIGAALDDCIDGKNLSETVYNTHNYIVSLSTSFFSGFIGFLYGINDNNKDKNIKELSRRKQLIEGIADNITASVLLLSKDMTILWANKMSEKHYGYALDEMIGKTCYEITHSEKEICKDKDHPCPIINFPQSEGLVEHVHKNKQGIENIFEINSIPIKNSNGEIVQYLHISRDITSRKKFEKIENDEKEKLNSLLNNNIWGIYSCNESGEYLSMNDTFAKIFGFETSKEMILNKNAKTLYTNVEDRYKFIGELSDKKMVYNKILNLKTKDEIPVSVLCSANINNERIINGIVRKIDNTEKEFITICAYCSDIKEKNESNEELAWVKPADYLMKHKHEIKDPTKDFDFSHGICKPCYTIMLNQLNNELDNSK